MSNASAIVFGLALWGLLAVGIVAIVRRARHKEGRSLQPLVQVLVVIAGVSLVLAEVLT